VTATHPRIILTTLVLGVSSYTLLQSLVVPALPALQRDLHSSTTSVAWVFTAFLLSASVATPIAGRLGDMYGKKRVLVIALLGIVVGALIAALADSLSLLIAGRAVQGLGGAIFPMAFGIIRDEFPAERITGAIALISGMLGIGSGLGIVLAGPILQHLSYQWLFWIPFMVASISIVVTIVLIPESPVRAPGTVYWTGAVLLSGWLVSLLLAVSQGPRWGWGSVRTDGMFALACLLVVAWVCAESRTRFPLVEMNMMRLRGVWTTNIAGLLLGAAMFAGFVLIPQYVEAPTSSGYGFGASVTQAGIFLLPWTVAMLIVSPLGGKLAGVVGSKVPLVVGLAITAGAFVVLSTESSRGWIYVASGTLGIGIGLAFAALANLIVEAVPREQVGVASGMNAIVRTIAVLSAQTSRRASSERMPAPTDCPQGTAMRSHLCSVRPC
jgi:MFS family permease